MIRNIQLKHAGKYVCVVDTDVESLSAAAILIVKGKFSLVEICYWNLDGNVIKIWWGDVYLLTCPVPVYYAYTNLQINSLVFDISE